MKKYFFFAAAALAALASCSKVEPEDQNGPEITFQAANYKSATKADGDNAGHLELYKDGTGFGVYAYFTPTNWATDGASYSPETPFMNNIEIQFGRTNAPATWSPEDTYYWPKTGALSFIGYYPKMDSNVSVENTGADGNASIKFTDYSVTASAAEQQGESKTGLYKDSAEDYDYNDLMTAAFVRDQKSNSNTHFTNGVPMVFSHVLAKVRINAKLKKLTTTEEDGAAKTSVNGITYAVTLDDVQINNITIAGTYSNGAWSAASDAVTTKTGSSASLYGVCAKPAEVAVSTTDAPTNISSTTPLTNKYAQIGHDYYVMPQTIADASTLVVTYTVYVIDSEGKILSKEQHTTSSADKHPGAQAAIKLNSIKNSNSIAIDKWAKNTIYSYNLEISPVSDDPIYFDAAVIDWAADIVKSEDVLIEEKEQN